MLAFREIKKTALENQTPVVNTLAKVYESENFVVSGILDFDSEDISAMPENLYPYLKETPVEERTPDKAIRYFSVEIAARSAAYANTIRGRFDCFTKTMDYNFGSNMRDSKQDVLAEELMQIEKILVADWSKFVDFGNTEDLGGAEA